MYRIFQSRTEAGIHLADALTSHQKEDNTIVLALMRGGVPVALEVADNLSLPMDIWIVRKLCVPGHEEVSMGAIALGNACYINHRLIDGLNVSQEKMDQEVQRERKELMRHNNLYRKGRSPPETRGKTVIVVNDGLAGGALLCGAIETLRHAGAKRVIVALPVGDAATLAQITSLADDVVCLNIPEYFCGAGQWYQDFPQTSNEEVREILDIYEDVSKGTASACPQKTNQGNFFSMRSVSE